MIRKILSGRGIVALASVLAISVVFSACKKDNDIPQVPSAGLMAFNLVPDQPGVGVALSGNLLPGGPLPYTSFTGRYYNVYTGSRVIESFNAASNQILDSLQYTFEQNKLYSLFVVGANGDYQNIVALDNVDSLTTSSGKAYVRYVNAIPGSNGSSVTMNAAGSNVVNENAPFGKVSQFVAVAPGEVNVGITNNGSVNKSRSITLQQQKAYTVLLTGLPNQADSTKAVQIRFIENGTVTD